MSAYDDEPAFPINGAVADNQFNGMSLRDYFAAHAPWPPQRWFKPSMPTERPEPMTYRGGARTREELDANGTAIQAWDEELAKQMYVQWPYAYADAVLKARQS